MADKTIKYVGFKETVTQKIDRQVQEIPLNLPT